MAPVPSALVQVGTRNWGQFDDRPRYVNPLQEYVGATQRTKRLRLKEWLGWTLVHPELSSSMILQDAHYLASTELYVRDAASGRLTEHSRNLRGGSLRLPEELYPSSPKVAKPGYAISYDFGPMAGMHSIDVEIAGTDKEPPVSAHLELDGARASAALSVSQPLRHGALYTYKRVFPAAGELTVADRTYVFEPQRDLAILDEHKSFLPYRTSWVWGTFATMVEDGILGANLCQRDARPGTPGESCAWLPGPACVGLDAPTFAPTTSDAAGPWRVSSPDALVDLTFEPDGRKNVNHQLVLFAIDYFQLYGTWSGTVAGRAVDGVRGVLESMKARL